MTPSRAGRRASSIGLQVFGLTADLAARRRAHGRRARRCSARSARARSRAGAFDARVSRAVVVGVAGAVAAGAVWKLFHAAPGRALALRSAALGGWPRALVLR